MTTLSLSELVFLLFESDSTPLHVSGLMMLRPPQDVQDFGLRLHRQLVRCGPVVAPFDQVIHCSTSRVPKWLPADEVDLSYHVRLAKLPKPGDADQLMELVARIHSYRLDRSRPLWELWVIDGLESGDIALVMKFHHALTDGLRAASLVADSFELSEHLGYLVPFWQLGSRIDEQPPELSQWLEALSPSFWVKQAKIGLDSLKLLGMAAGDRLSLTASGIRLPFTAPRTPFNDISSDRAKQVILSKLPASRLSRLATYTGARFDDVVLTLCDMALHRYLKVHNWRDRDPLVAMVPLRDGEEGDRLHMISVGLVELGKPGMTPMQRLKTIGRTNRRIREQTRRTSAKAYNRYSSVVNALALVAARYDDKQWLPPAANMLISEVEAADHPLSLLGAKLTASYPLSLLMPGQTLNMTLMHYDGVLHFGLVCCRHSLPGIESFDRYLEEGLEELESSVFSHISSRLTPAN
ncbi:wax ester/triacylglycerol synthase domain-containing protein [Ferrimonas sp. YFM]|uniref:wax ester/triacylglycerol synthase domain-containing protein n=1 Tax=Ferrimonas sp. YFM TaxID=3028878 RepID=UPI0025740839|nr:wax ester/triacylglycerol synthase domain-containing protein [Ferrimonas sp. YFM]BDY05096.1 diacylglycerol O-acyltransferase [Ferrimonas sp. YFM]